jgi:hypothetical protein
MRSLTLNQNCIRWRIRQRVRVTSATRAPLPRPIGALEARGRLAPPPSAPLSNRKAGDELLDLARDIAGAGTGDGGGDARGFKPRPAATRPAVYEVRLGGSVQLRTAAPMTNGAVAATIRQPAWQNLFPCNRGSFMDEKLWAGVELKLQYAEFHLQMMGRSLDLPKPTALEAYGMIRDTGWQRSLYAYFDAFLSRARSVPEIIQCCFGVDDRSPREIKEWFKKLPADELDRRQEFKKHFKRHYDCFCALPLGRARHISEHRTGVAPVTVTISGMFGVIYRGNAAERIPLSETRQIDDPDRAFLANPIPIQPTWNDFDIDGQPLFPACQKYLDDARVLIDEARRMALRIHGAHSLSSPPT